MSLPEMRQQALEQRRRRDQSRRAALRWNAHKERVRRRIAAFEGVAVHPWGCLVGKADPSGLDSHLLCSFQRYVIFTGGCHGKGSLFQSEAIEDAILKSVRGLFLSGDGVPRYLLPDGSALRNAMNITCAVAGFSILADAKVHLAKLHEA